jgi:guanylate kinase
LSKPEINSGSLITISAPSGSGKTTIVKEILKEFPGLVFSISATTRKKRGNETDGKDYFFLSEEEFKRRIENEEFVEWEEVYGCYYGTFKRFIEDNIKAGKKVLLEVDVKGALSIKKIYPEAILIYIVPPDMDELVNRLKKRNTEDEESLQKRIERAEMELSHTEDFDYLVENKDLDKAVADTKSLIRKIIKE